MAEIVKNITDARDNGTINVYAVCYKQRGKAENVAVALPGNLNFDLRSNFCENVVRYKDAREKEFNPTSDGLEDDTYEYIPLENVQKNWDEITKLLDDADDYYDKESKQKVSRSNLFVCALDYNNSRYYFCAKQGDNSDKLLKGKHIFMSQQEKLIEISSDKIFLLSCYVGFLIDVNEKKVLIFDKKMFQGIFKYDDYQRESVKGKISIVDKTKPYMYTVYKLCNALDIPISDLLIEPCDETIENISKEEQELLMLYRKCTPSKRHLLKVYLQMLTQFQEKF